MTISLKHLEWNTAEEWVAMRLPFAPKSITSFHYWLRKSMATNGGLPERQKGVRRNYPDGKGNTPFFYHYTRLPEAAAAAFERIYAGDLKLVVRVRAGDDTGASVRVVGSKNLNK